MAIIELHGTTVLTMNTFLWCKGELCQVRDSTGHSVNRRFSKFGEQINGTNYFYAKDSLGNIREMIDSSGAVHTSYDYDLWGRQKKLAGDLDADFGYAGLYFEKTANLNLTWFRAYNPEIGRWLSRDPLADNNPHFYTGPNFYAYVFNNPVIFTDPLGLGVFGDIGKWIENEATTFGDAIMGLFSKGRIGSPIPADAVGAAGESVGAACTIVHAQQTVGPMYEEAGAGNPYGPTATPTPSAK